MGEMQSNWFARHKDEQWMEKLREERRGVEAERQQLEQDRMQQRADAERYRAERRGRAGFGQVPCIGLQEQGVLEELAARNAKLVRREVVGGAVLYSYKHSYTLSLEQRWERGDELGDLEMGVLATAWGRVNRGEQLSAQERAALSRGDKLEWKIANSAEQQSKAAQARLGALVGECRGLVLSGGEVVVRPVQRFLKVRQMVGLAQAVMPVTVTEKLDGVMVCGVVAGDGVELWTRGGWTEQAVSATRFAEREQAGVLQLVWEVQQRGGTATFEYVGKQNVVKVQYAKTRLVLLVVRDRDTGEWWEYELLEELCERHGVELVRRIVQLEQKVMAEVESEVLRWKGVEGVVAWMGGGRACKVKTRWWLDAGSGMQRRWCGSGAVREQAEQRHRKRQRHMETREQRVVVQGWDCRVSPVGVFGVFGAASKVEACYRRSDGRQGTLVVCFRQEEDASAARGVYRTVGGQVEAVGSYSARMVSNGDRVVRAWWRRDEWVDE